MKRKFVVAILDSGFSESQLSKVVSQRSFDCSESNAAAGTLPDCIDRIGHGSALIDIILAHNPDTHFMVAKIFHNKLSTDVTQTVAALDWLTSQGPDLISMSFGLHRDHKTLHHACHQARTRGIILTAASPAHGRTVFPSSYPEVISATGDARCDSEEYSFLGTPQADFGACVRSNDKNVVGASSATAHMAGHITKLLSQQPLSNRPVEYSELYALLKRNAAYQGQEKRDAKVH